MTPSNHRSTRSKPRFAIIGAGFAGLTAAIQLIRRGVEVDVFERSDGIGGVWRANHYPGATCDVPSFLYSWSFAQKSDWSTRFATQPEILAYIEKTVDDQGLRDRIHTGREVTTLSWNVEQSTWTISFRDGNTQTADFVVAALGQMSSPAIPQIAGIESFEGAAFHTADWRDDVELRGRNVVVIGAGASALQVVPSIADSTSSVAVVQRSPAYVLSKGDVDYNGPQSLVAARLRRARSYISKEWNTPRLVRWPKLVASAEASYRQELRSWVTDEDLLKKVEPLDRYGCKRILVSNDWFKALQRSDVQLYDQDIAAIGPHHVLLADGTELPADVIVYGTGFHANLFLHGIEVHGTGGRRLDETWRRSPQAYLGMTIPNFPNLFLMYGPNTNPAWNSVLVMLECQVRYITGVARQWQRVGPFRMELRPEVARRFARQIAARSAHSVWVTGCRNWFLSAAGSNSQNWPALVTEYWLRTRRVRWSDYVVTGQTPARASDSVAEGVGRQKA